jgi:hypothetical protein
MKSNEKKILFHVGAPHAYKEYLNEDDYYTGEVPEAKYFNDQNADVYSIQIRPFYWGVNGEKVKELIDPIEKKALGEIGSANSIFVDLHEYKEIKDNTGIDKYCRNGKYQFDGIIYVNDKNDA